MQLRKKFVVYLLLIATIPLSLAMAVALWQSSDQTRKLTIDIVQGYLDAGAESLSGYFETRKAELGAYAHSPLLKGMQFYNIRPYLKSELNRHAGTYEKFILGTRQGHFYNTAGGNPAQQGLRTFNDSDPKAKPKTIAKRDYWKYTVGTNNQNQARIFVSDPMISYTTGAKQIVVAASIQSTEGNVVGMVGGALPWKNFESKVNEIFSDIIEHQKWDSRFFLLTSNGTYWYHWDPAFVVQLAKDSNGKVQVNEIGEKVAVVTKITDDPNPEFVKAGHAMMNGKRGYTLYTDQASNQEHYLVYAPIKSTGYAVGLVVPKKQMMSPVQRLSNIFIIILLTAVFLVAIIALVLSKRIVHPITSLNKFVQATDHGDEKNNIIPKGNDEVTELTRSFNSLINSITKRENSIKKLNEELEERVTKRTGELEDTNVKLVEAETRQSAILESVIDSLITIDEIGTIESVNQATTTMFGYSEDQMVGKNVKMLMPEPYKNEHDIYLQNYHSTGQAKVLGIGRELLARKKDGTIFPIELSLSEMFIKNAKKFTGIIRDISERKFAEEQLRRDSNALKRLNEIAANPYEDFKQKSKKLLKLGLDTFEMDLGIISRIEDDIYTVEQIIGPEGAPPTGTTFDVSHTYCAHTYAANGPVAFDNAGNSEIRNHPCYQNFKLESYIGVPIFVNGQRYGTLNFSSPEIHTPPFTTGELTLIQLLAQWIGSELSRSRSEQELGRFKTTLDLTMDCVFMFDAESLAFFYVNQGAINQIGYSAQELLNMKPYDIKPEFGESEFIELIQPMLAGDKPTVNFETIHQHKNGKRIPVEIFLQYIAPQGEQPRFVAIVRDITERQEATRQLNNTIDEMAQRTREITLLSSLGDLLHSCQDLNEAYEVIARFMPMLLPRLSGALYLSQESGASFEKVSDWGKDAPSLSNFPADDCVAVRRGLAYQTTNDESALFCKHLDKQSPFLSLCIPLSAQGETFGIIHLQSATRNNDITSGVDENLQQGFAETVAKQVSMALASLRLKALLRNQSIRDPLTGLFNRRYMEETFDREIHRALRNQTSLTFVMIDIDHFKSVNDKFGHETGDVILKEFAALLKNTTRSEDIACRYGGEEFVLCLPGASSETAFERIDTIRHNMSSRTFHHEGQKIGQVTMSAGIASYPHHGENVVDLVKHADKALYLAKQSGRNQVQVAQTPN